MTKKNIVAYTVIALMFGAMGIVAALNQKAPAALAPAVSALYAQQLPDAKGVTQALSQWKGKTIVLNWRFTDTRQDYVLSLENSALSHMADQVDPNANATLTLTRATLDEISLQRLTFPEALQSGRMQVTGQAEKLAELLSMLDITTVMFNIIEPRPAR